MSTSNKKFSLTNITLTLAIAGFFFAFLADKHPLLTPVCLFLVAAIQCLQGFKLYHKDRKSSYFHFAISILLTINNIRVFVF